MRWYLYKNSEFYEKAWAFSIKYIVLIFFYERERAFFFLLHDIQFEQCFAAGLPDVDSAVCAHDGESLVVDRPFHNTDFRLKLQVDGRVLNLQIALGQYPTAGRELISSSRLDVVKLQAFLHKGDSKILQVQIPRLLHWERFDCLGGALPEIDHSHQIVSALLEARVEYVPNSDFGVFVCSEQHAFVHSLVGPLLSFDVVALVGDAN